MDIENPLIEWHIYRFHRLIQRKRRPGMIQSTRLHHMFIKRRRDLVRLTVVHRPHRPDHGAEPNEFRVPHLATDDPLDRTVSVAQSKRRLEWMFPIWETMTRKVNPFVLAELFDDPRNAGRLVNVA